MKMSKIQILSKETRSVEAMRQSEEVRTKKIYGLQQYFTLFTLFITYHYTNDEIRES